MAKSKFFRAFVAGQTISDGRKIDSAWIDPVPLITGRHAAPSLTSTAK